jgi:hypothetical protein
VLDVIEKWPKDDPEQVTRLVTTSQELKQLYESLVRNLQAIERAVNGN